MTDLTGKFEIKGVIDNLLVIDSGAKIIKIVVLDLCEYEKIERFTRDTLYFIRG